MERGIGRYPQIALALAGLNGLMAVAAGAFGAHAASDPGVKELLRTGAIYQLAHAGAGLACVSQGQFGRTPLAGLLFGVGALVFGGSLYGLALSGLRVLGAATPLGGLLMLAGWSVVIWSAARGSHT